MIAVTLKYLCDGYYDQRLIVVQYEWWLTDHKIEHTFIKVGSINGLPTVVLMPPEDATAFKLRFGL